ncbi:MAG TPA: carboxypeptidase-like regulatory domain-containing protein [Longimicrobiaceae bacterium]|nr:carboxypeptidase-like regulatory domain-containing protein [Longimicrobiaceae bacterium]
MLRLLPLLVLLAAAAPIAAQTVRGAVVDEGGSPVAAAFVVLLDVEGRPAARGLSHAGGGFLLHAGMAGTYTLRAERIGFESTVTPPLRLEQGAVVETRVTVSSRAVALDAIVVGGAAQCAVRARDDAAAAALWEEARKALAVSAWTERAESLQVVAARWERELDRQGMFILAERRDSIVGRLQTPFRSLPAEELAAAGYRREESDGAWYYAPDAEVLLSDSFLDTHCFRAVRGRGRARGLVGLAFEPVRGRSVPDVAGTLWLDARSAELRHLEFRYRNLPRQDDWPGVGGRIEFRRLPGGQWIVDRWRLRMPLVRHPRRGRATLAGYAEVGGQVHSAAPAPGGEG